MKDIKDLGIDNEYNAQEDEYLFQGEDNSDNINDFPEDECVYPVKDIKVEKNFYTIFELKRKYSRKPSNIILDSDFQRESVWKISQKRELIESILMGLPLPLFYFNKDKNGNLIVIDGRQRLGAIFSFIDNEFKLDNLKILSEFNKFNFSDLDPLYQSKIEDYQVFAYVIQPSTPDRVKFDIFDRVNRSGTQLNKQEIRNALYQGKVTKLLNELCKTEEFNIATEGALSKDKRMKDRYLLLRFIAFYLYFNGKLKKTDNSNSLYEYGGDIDDLLGKTMDCVNDMTDNEVEILKRITIESLEKCHFYIGNNAFRLTDIKEDGTIKRYPININIFETLMFGMTMLPNDVSEIRNKVSERFEFLKRSDSFRESLNNHRDSEMKVKYRFEAINKIFGDITQ